MSDLMLIGVLRMPITPQSHELTLMQYIDRGRQAANLIEQQQRELERLERSVEEEIDIRDNYHDWADKLSGALAKVYQVDIGEHSSANHPWSNALDAGNFINNRVDLLQQERDALAAHVDSLKASSCKLCELTEEGEFYERCEAANDLMEVVEQSPTTSLNAVRREVIENLLNYGAELRHKRWIVNPMNGLECPGVDAIKEQGFSLSSSDIKGFANTKYPIDGEG